MNHTKTEKCVKKPKIRFLSWLLILAISITMIPTQAFASVIDTVRENGAAENEQNESDSKELAASDEQSNVIPEAGTEEFNEGDEITGAYKDLKIRDMPEELKEAVIDEETRALDETGTVDVVTGAELKSLNTVTADDTKSIQIFDTPIKYVADGEIQFIDSSLTASDEEISKNETYAYENQANSIKVYLPETTADSVKISDGAGYTIEQQPIGDKIASVDKKQFRFLSEELEVAEYKDVFGEGYDLQYSPQNDGVRENIVIQEDNGIYNFDFILNAPGLVPKEMTGESIHFIAKESSAQENMPETNVLDEVPDENSLENGLEVENTPLPEKIETKKDALASAAKKEPRVTADSKLDDSTSKELQPEDVVFTLGELFLRDSYVGEPDGEDHFSFDNTYRLERLGDDKYKVTYRIDAAFLKKESTKYPVLLDPSISPITAMYDSPVYSLRPTANFAANTWVQLGDVAGTYGLGYGYFKIDSIAKYTYINPKNITKAVLRVYEGSGTTYTSTIKAFDCAETWSSGSITYNNRPAKYGNAVSSINIAKSGYYEFAITPLVKNWISDELWEGGYSQHYGVMLAPNVATTKRKDFCSANYPTVSMRPSIKIEYTEDTSLADGTYFISNWGSDLALDANPANNNVRQAAITNTDKQQWIVTNVGSGYYTIANKYYGTSGRLNVEDPSITYPNAHILPGGSGDRIRFKIIKNNDGSGTYRIAAKSLADLKNLCIANGSINAGANAQFSAYSGDLKHQWKFKAATTRYTLPDLEVQTVSVPTINAPYASSYTFSAKVYNNYSKVAATTTRFEFLNSSGSVLKTVNVSTPALDGNAAATVSAAFVPPASGSYQVRVTADATAARSEYSETNNSRTATVAAGNVGGGLTGSLETVSGSTVKGWAYTGAANTTALDVKITVKNTAGSIVYEKMVKADQLRSDLLSKGYGNGKHGFTHNIDFSALDAGTYTVTATEIYGTSSLTLPNSGKQLNVKEKIYHVTPMPLDTTFQLTNPLDTDTTVTWKSSNIAIATVSSTGLVTAKGKGTAKITATSTADSTKKASCLITVTGTEEKRFYGVSGGYAPTGRL